MKNNTLKLLRLIAVAAIIINLSSCLKENVKPSANVDAYTEEQLISESLLPGETAVAAVSPGLYRIAKFIDTGDDETAQFNGYRFRFRSNGTLVATTNTGKVFTGSYALNSNQTKMEIVIGGTEALEDLDDDDWRVALLTDTRIRLTAPDPDVVVFVKIQ